MNLDFDTFPAVALSPRKQVELLLKKALQRLVEQGILLPEASEQAFRLQIPKEKQFGDFTTTLALSLAQKTGVPPRQLAEKLRLSLEADPKYPLLLEKCALAGPGYINFTLQRDVWLQHLFEILQQGRNYLHSTTLQGQHILLEYVSANPTGPLHVAHGRGAVIGDVLANLLEVSGATVEREYYVNDLGHQIDVMAVSLYWRYLQLCGVNEPPPEEHYPGAYLVEAAEKIVATDKDKYVKTAPSFWLDTFKAYGITLMLQRIKEDLQAFGVDFDHYVSEKDLYQQKIPENLLKRLEQTEHLYTQDGKKWLRSTTFGDDKDRVILREDGRPTYVTTDIAYHEQKIKRGYHRLINIWGADHAGYLARIEAGLKALGEDSSPLKVIFIQMVSLSNAGESIRMGKRLGTAVWLRDIIEEVGKDATRYFFLMKRCDAQMDFDIALAKEQTIHNPVFYAQMGYARLCAIARKAAEKNIPLPQIDRQVLNQLTLLEERQLILALSRAPDVLNDAVDALEPHQIVHYIQELIAQFHSYYSQYSKGEDKVISSDPQKTAARLLLCQALQVVLKRYLELLGVSAPERMSLDTETSALL